MKPLNEAERRNAFLGFLILFLLTIGVITTVILFSVEVPMQDNEQLRKTVFIMEQEKKFSNSFTNAMRAAMYELENFDVKKGPASAYRVESEINKMRRLLDDLPDSSSYIYESVVKNLEQLNEAKMKSGLEQ